MNSLAVCGSFAKFGNNLMCHILGDKVNSVVVVAELGEISRGLEVHDIAVFVLHGNYVCILYRAQ